MSSALRLDAATASWLAGLDPALTLLPRALPPAATDPSWSLHDVRWTPGEGCRLAYRVGSPGRPARFVAVHVDAGGVSQRDYHDDPKLPGVAEAADPVAASDLLSTALGEPVRGLHVEPVRYRPGSRCVLRYDLQTASRGSTMYAKALRPERFDDVAVSGTSRRASADEALVPEVVALWPRLRTVVGGAVDGRAMSTVLGDPGTPTDERARLAFRLGDLLARFHGQNGVTAPPWSAADQLAAIAGATGAVRCVDARIASRVQAVLDELNATAPVAGGPVVVGHGAFRAAQVVVTNDDRLVALDTDGVCRCDPGRDLGTVLAHLRWQAIRQPGQRPALLGAERALLSGYRRRAGDVDPASLLWWRAAGMLQVAVRRYRRLELSAWPQVPDLVDCAAQLLAAQRAQPTSNGATDPLDTDRMSSVLSLALAPVAAVPGAVRADSAVELAAASGRRRVVRYTVRGLDGADPVPVIAKVFAEPRRAGLLHEHLRLLSTGPFHAGPMRVPEPLGLSLRHRLVLYRCADGVPLDRIADPERTADGVRQAARWLARLHACEVRLPRRFSLAQEAETTRQWAALIGQARPPAATAARRLAARWLVAARMATLADDQPIHKDFHAGHVLVGDGVCVIDLDEARQGDPAFDLAHFCTYLAVRGDHRGVLRRAFLAEYVAAGGRVGQDAYRAFCAYSWLKIAKQQVVGSGPGRGEPPEHRLAVAERALEEGEACLDA